MINLLPTELKEAYTYAQYNSKLMRWVISFAAAIGGLALISIAGLLYVYQTSHSYDNQVTELTQTLEKQKLKETEAKTKEISNDLKLAVKVLSKEVLFSQLLKQLASLTPSSVTLSDLTITETQGGLDIAAQATSYETATQFQINLSDKNNKLFSKADIVSITCGGEGSTESETRYPCDVNIRALFAKDNPFLFINNKGTTR